MQDAGVQSSNLYRHHWPNPSAMKSKQDVVTPQYTISLMTETNQ
jgi:hypothetical protein